MKMNPLAWIFGAMADAEELGAAIAIVGIVAVIVGVCYWISVQRL